MKTIAKSQAETLTSVPILGLVLLLITGLAPAAAATNCVSSPSGLVAWWRGEGNGNDSAGANNGVLLNGVGFTNGMVGQAFAFDGVNDAVIVSNAPGLNFGPGKDFSIEVWIEPLPSSTDFGVMTIVEKRLSPSWAQDVGYELTVIYGQLQLRMSDSLSGPSYAFGPAGPDTRDGKFHHVAVTVVRNSATGGKLYVDGQVVLTFDPTVASGDLSNTEPLRIGVNANATFFSNYKGAIDEVSLYNRALTAAEVQDIYSAGGAGKCGVLVPPIISSQPASQAAFVGDTVAFNVTAEGDAPLSYQWRWNGAGVAGQTASSLTLNNVQLTNAGSYSVVVTNPAGSAISSNAVLTVTARSNCAPAPSGLVAWWRGEGNGKDSVGTNNGVLLNGVGFTNGMVGQAFAFDGVNDAVIVSNAPGLNFGPGKDFSIEVWIEPLPSSTDFGVMTIVDKRFSPSWTHDVGYELAVLYGQLHWRMSASLSGPSYGFGPAGPDLRDGKFHHVAVTLVRNSATGGKLYVDGQVVLTFDPTVAMGDLSNTEPLRIGVGANATFFSNYRGAMDEVSLYNRALTAAEVQAIYGAEDAGKCKTSVPPSIVSQPVSQSALVGDTVAFSVTTTGDLPLSYQWRFNGVGLIGQTASTLSLSHVQLADAGSYSVLVTNLAGSAVSSNAVLMVNSIPVAQCADVIVSAGTNCMADASVNNGSFDPDGGPITVSQVPPGPYPLGTNQVTLTVTDTHGASNSCSGLVIVRDETPPVIVCAPDKQVEFQGETGAVATYSVTATDLCSAVSLTVTPPSGSLFPIGVTPVMVRATDSSGNRAQCSFTVTVLGALGVKSNVLAELVALRAGANPPQPFAQKFDDAIQHLANSLDPAYWIDQTHLQPRGGNTAMNEEKLAANELDNIMGSDQCPVNRAALQDFINRIVKCDRLLAVISIQDAANAGLNPKKISQDLAMVDKGDRESAAGHYANAIEHYRNAWRHGLQLRIQVAPAPDRRLQVGFVGNNSRSYRIEVSADLVNWLPAGSCTADSDGNVEFTDANPANEGVRFYRAVEQ